MPNPTTHFTVDLVCDQCGRDRTKLGALELPFGLSADDFDDLIRTHGWKILSTGRSGLVSIVCPECQAEEAKGEIFVSHLPAHY